MDFSSVDISRIVGSIIELNKSGVVSVYPARQLSGLGKIEIDELLLRLKALPNQASSVLQNYYWPEGSLGINFAHTYVVRVYFAGLEE
jgi:hypothetical protein